MSEYMRENKYPWIGLKTLLEKDEKIITYGVCYPHVPFIIPRLLPFFQAWGYKLEKYYYVALTDRRIILCRAPQQPDKFEFCKSVSYQNAEIKEGNFFVKFGIDKIEKLDFEMQRRHPPGLNRDEFFEVFLKQKERKK